MIPNHVLGTRGEKRVRVQAKEPLCPVSFQGASLQSFPGRVSRVPNGLSDPPPLVKGSSEACAPCDLRGQVGGGVDGLESPPAASARAAWGGFNASLMWGNGSVLPIPACPSLTRGRRKAERAPLNCRELGGGELGRFLLSSRRLCRRGRPWPTPASAADPARTGTCTWPGAGADEEEKNPRLFHLPEIPILGIFFPQGLRPFRFDPMTK